MSVPKWFAGAGLGIFVHWDHASQQGIEISWPLVGKSILPGSAEVEAPPPSTPSAGTPWGWPVWPVRAALVMSS